MSEKAKVIADGKRVQEDSITRAHRLLHEASETIKVGYEAAQRQYDAGDHEALEDVNRWHLWRRIVGAVRDDIGSCS